jgi:hypothetical protein
MTRQSQASVSTQTKLGGGFYFAWTRGCMLCLLFWCALLVYGYVFKGVAMPSVRAGV